jgi:hypothetical protein
MPWNNQGVLRTRAYQKPGKAIVDDERISVEGSTYPDSRMINPLVRNSVLFQLLRSQICCE